MDSGDLIRDAFELLIVVAIVLSLAGLMYLAYDPRVYELRRKPGTNVFRPCSPEHPQDEAIPGLLIARPEDRLYFGNAANVGAKLLALTRAAAPAPSGPAQSPHVPGVRRSRLPGVPEVPSLRRRAA